MPALDFPSTPLLNDKYPQPPLVGQPVYTWDGAKWTTGDTSIQAMGEPSNAIPRMDGSPGEVGTSLDYARGDHRHPVDASRAPIADPAFIGTPTAPTPSVGDSSERLATTAFVVEAAFVMGNALPSDSTPLMDGAPVPGTSISYSRDDHVHPPDLSRAPLADPVFTGVPIAPTAASGTSTAQIATTAFVDDAVTGAGAISPSDVLPLINSGTGAVGVSAAYSRGDHVHPNNSPLPATVAPLGDAGTAAVGSSLKYAKEDHVHPENPDATTKTYVDTALAGKSDTGHTHTSTGITDFKEAVEDRVGALLVAGTNVTLDYNDTASTLTITSTAAGGGGGTGDVLGPTSAVADRIAVFNGTTGKIIKDGGVLVAGLQPIDAELTAIAGLVGAADRLPYFTGPGAAALTPLTGFGRSLIDDADATAAKTTLGIAGAALSKTDDTNVTLTLGGSPSTALLTAANITAGWAGTLSAARGGFGQNVAAQTGVPLFATGVATFTGTNGTGNFVRTTDAVLAGNPTAPTPSAGDNDTSIATTAFVTTAVTASGATGANIIVNGSFRINQAGYGSATVLAAGAYGHDQWKAGASGGDYSFTQLKSNTQITIASGKSLIQPIEDYNVVGGSYVLSWTGTAQARAGVNTLTPSGSYAASPLSIAGQTAGTAMSVEFNNGTLGTVKLESGTKATPFFMRSLGEELAICQRYYAIYTDIVAADYEAGGSPMMNTFSYNTTMRVAPTISYGVGSQANCSGIYTSTNNTTLLVTYTTVTATGDAQLVYTIVADARL